MKQFLNFLRDCFVIEEELELSNFQMYIVGERWGNKSVVKYCNLFNLFPALCLSYNDTNLNISAIHYDNGLTEIEQIGSTTVTIGYEEGTTATYVSPEGFISVGYTTTTTCTNSRNWSQVLSLDPCYPGDGT